MRGRESIIVSFLNRNGFSESASSINFVKNNSITKLKEIYNLEKTFFNRFLEWKIILSEKCGMVMLLENLLL